MRWAGNVARMGRGEKCTRVFVRKPEGQELVEETSRRWEDNIKLTLKIIELDDVNLIRSAYFRFSFLASYITVINIQIP
jgi:hypothetical protein